jgi:hypothetical protein
MWPKARDPLMILEEGASGYGPCLSVEAASIRRS